VLLREAPVGQVLDRAKCEDSAGDGTDLDQSSLGGTLFDVDLQRRANEL
jgi:hypothetical protein